MRAGHDCPLTYQRVTQSFISTHRDPIHPYSRPFMRTVGQGLPIQMGPGAHPRERVGLVGEVGAFIPQFSRRDPAGTPSVLLAVPSCPASPAGPRNYSLAAEARSGRGRKNSSGSKQCAATFCTHREGHIWRMPILSTSLHIECFYELVTFIQMQSRAIQRKRNEK